jgi:hypothetical protein
MTKVAKVETVLITMLLTITINNFVFAQNIKKSNSEIFIYNSDKSKDKCISFIWPVTNEAEWPVQKSNEIQDIEFTGRFANYTKADTWYPSWASDGNLYSPWTDGNIGEAGCSSGGEKASTGHAKIEGEHPFQLKITNLGTQKASPAPYGGRYPCGSLIYNGIWYYGTYTLTHSNYGLNWPILGPFSGFRISHDMGITWEDSPVSCEPGQTLFPEPEKINGPVKIGAPHFVDFGKDMEHSPDGKAYLIAHGAAENDLEDRKANLSWITGDQIYLCRVTPSPENMNNENAYEYFAGHDNSGNPIWSNDYNLIQPLVNWDNNTGCVTMTYNAPLKKYIMCVTDGWPTVENMNTYLLESDKITGPWTMITYMKNFGPQAYFVNIPSKFISENGTRYYCR